MSTGDAGNPLIDALDRGSRDVRGILARALDAAEVSVAEAMCYPRPLQEKIPILVGGSGERKTLKLVARYADACNLFGDAANVRRKLAVLHEHCAAEHRDPASITVTHLAAGRVIADGEPREGQGAATVDEHVGRLRELAEAGVQTAIVNMPDVQDVEAVARFGEVIRAFSVQSEPARSAF